MDYYNRIADKLLTERLQSSGAVPIEGTKGLQTKLLKISA